MSSCQRPTDKELEKDVDNWHANACVSDTISIDDAEDLIQCLESSRISSRALRTQGSALAAKMDGLAQVRAHRKLLPRDVATIKGELLTGLLPPDSIEMSTASLIRTIERDDAVHQYLVHHDNLFMDVRDIPCNPNAKDALLFELNRLDSELDGALASLPTTPPIVPPLVTLRAAKLHEEYAPVVHQRTARLQARLSLEMPVRADRDATVAAHTIMRQVHAQRVSLVAAHARIKHSCVAKTVRIMSEHAARVRSARERKAERAAAQRAAEEVHAVVEAWRAATVAELAAAAERKERVARERAERERSEAERRARDLDRRQSAGRARQVERARMVAAEEAKLEALRLVLEAEVVHVAAERRGRVADLQDLWEEKLAKRREIKRIRLTEERESEGFLEQFVGKFATGFKSSGPGYSDATVFKDPRAKLLHLLGQRDSVGLSKSAQTYLLSTLAHMQPDRRATHLQSSIRFGEDSNTG
ncbi:hypothetical protein AMAG_13953 [Allomyces macrogynus ATCC 38327]|uniref:Uncharacterized protein n=1 Tax=Allomyces macrogynus (strain ATCC 38327) TaxID=578462 RepID=A0A0L0T2L2_ALLM3|nr:hypothetical protein AMAG_13953 [Allomyces macrogynus ATCC 38327]|eukprot:KNE69083.1 hypothetical protein AMAG_13953 [Allomyces macrogynus ATCC 38327]